MCARLTGRDVLHDHVDVDLGAGHGLEDLGGRARLVGDGDDRDLGFAAVMSDAGDQCLLHGKILHRSGDHGAGVLRVRRADMDRHLEAPRVLDAAQHQHLGAAGGQLEHLLVGDLLDVPRLRAILVNTKVTGILKDNGHKSHITFEALASWSTLKSLREKGTFNSDDTDWSNSYNGWTYVLVDKDHEPTEIEAHLADIAKHHDAEKNSSGEPRRYKFALQNLSSITPGPFINNPHRSVHARYIHILFSAALR